MPNRVIREGFLDSEKINSLSESEQNFFIRLMLIADDYGKYDARPELLRSRCYPVSDKRLTFIKESLKKLNIIKLITLYEVEQKQYLQILNFNQRTRIMKSKYPDSINGTQVSDTCQTKDGLKPIQSESNPKPNPKRNQTELSNFDTALKDFSDMRKKQRKPLTDKAKQMLLIKLQKLSSDEKTQIQILNQSTMNSWLGVFPLKESKPNKDFSPADAAAQVERIFGDG